VLRPLQDLFRPVDYPDLLVGLGAPDDAAVYRLDEARALIVTTDFFTPIVDDPYQYGAIAAANALSDVYAMGGRPLLALNIAALPPTLPPEMIAQIMVGLAEKVREAGAVIAGGHTIQDKEPKVGLAVVGLASPDRLLTKGGARPGDWLILTKPLGTGCITTAAKSDQARPDDLVEAAAWMMRLNRDAAEVAEGVGACAATDITGFGLLGHATELAEASGVTLHLDAAQMPLLPGAEQYATSWIFPGGSAANREAYQRGVRVVGDLPEHRLMLLFDAQTSGGRQAPWWDVGQVGPREDVPLVVHA